MERIPPPRLPRAGPALGDELFADVAEVDVADAPAPTVADLTTSGEIVALVKRRTARFEWAAAAVAAVALVLAVGGWAALRWLSPSAPDATAAAHLDAADRLLSAGRLTGEGGALEHLLAARRLAPGDARAEARLSRVADLLEGLGTRALERGDLDVASIHLAEAQRAEPDRASVREKLARIAARRGAAPALPARR